MWFVHEISQSINENPYTNLDEEDTQLLAPVARLESIRLLLSIYCVYKFKLHQMDVKSVFLNGFLQEELFV